MRGRETHRTRRRSGGLLLTPLIDIIFLLALFFVLNTSFRQENYIDVQLPVSESAEDIQAVGMVLTLRKDGTTALDGLDLPWESLTTSIRSRAEETGATEIVVRADEMIPYGRAVGALDRIRLAGIVNISLQTVRDSGKQ